MKQLKYDFYWELVDKRGRASGFYTRRPYNMMYVHRIGFLRSKTYKQLIEHKVPIGTADNLPMIENDRKWLIVPFGEPMTTEEYIAAGYYKL